MLRCVLLFAVSSGSVVNSVTVKAGSNTPKPNDPVVVRGWRSDGFQKMDRTPKKAEKTLGKEVAPNDDLFNTNDLLRCLLRCSEVPRFKCTVTV